MVQCKCIVVELCLAICRTMFGGKIYQIRIGLKDEY